MLRPPLRFSLVLKIVYYILLLPFSLLPMWFLHGVSWLFYALMFYVVGYRKMVVHQNLKNAFPEKDETWVLTVRKAFFKHFSDTLIEAVKILSLRKKEFNKRYQTLNPELLNNYFEQNRHVILVFGHYNNWEWIGLGNHLALKHQTIAFYQQVKNPFIDQKLRTARERFGLKTIVSSNPKAMLRATSAQPTVLYFAADQSPRKEQKAYWCTFLNQETGVQIGVEKMAQKLDAVVVFGHLEKIKRSHYRMQYLLLSQSPKEEPFGAITNKHVRMLESIIREKPENWLWSHRRWKRKRPSDQALHD